MKIVIALVFGLLFSVGPVVAGLSGQEMLLPHLVGTHSNWLRIEIRQGRPAAAVLISGASNSLRQVDVGKFNILSENLIAKIAPQLSDGVVILASCADWNGESVLEANWTYKWIIIPSEIDMEAMRRKLPSGSKEFLISILTDSLRWVISAKASKLDPEVAHIMFVQAVEGLSTLDVPHGVILTYLGSVDQSEFNRSLASDILRYKLILGDGSEIIRVATLLEDPRFREHNHNLSVFIKMGLLQPLDKPLATDKLLFLWKTDIPELKIGVLSQVSALNIAEMKDILINSLQGKDKEAAYAAVRACNRVFGDSAIKMPGKNHFEQQEVQYVAQCSALLSSIPSIGFGLPSRK